MTIHWKAVEHYFIVVLLIFNFFCPGYNFEKFINFELDFVRSERVKACDLLRMKFETSCWKRFLERIGN